MRKLAWFAVFFAAAAFAVLTCSQKNVPVLWILPAAFAAASIFLLICRKREERWAVFLRIALLGLAVGCLYAVLWRGACERDMKPLLSSRQTVEAVVLEDSTAASFGLRTSVRIGRLRCCLYTDGANALKAGEKIRVTAEFRSTAEKTGGDYYLSLGLPLFGYAKGQPEILGEAEAQWRFLPAHAGRFLRERIGLLFDRECASFLTAILTGDRSLLRRDTHFYAMLRASGVSHCVAVSGMHLSFLVMFLYVLLGRGKLSALVCIPVTLGFMAMTGFTASVVRAGVMQIAVCGAKLFRREYDSLTALGLALLALLLINPYSILNAGLQLSFSATLGILLFCRPISEGLPHPPERWGKHSLLTRIWHAGNASLSVSFSAAILTVPLNAYYFGQISLLAPLTNLTVLWAVSLSFCLGLLAVLTSLLSMQAGLLLSVPVGLLVTYIRTVTGAVGRFPLAALYTGSIYLPCWLILTWASMALFRFLPGLRRRTLGFTATALLGLMLFLGLSYLEPALDTLRFCAVDVGQGQCLILSGEAGVTVIDCGGSQSVNAGDLAAEYLFSIGRFQTDRLILTHFHQDHVNGATELFERMPVHTLYCPKPEDDDEEAWELLAFAEGRGAAVVFVEDDVLRLQSGGLEMTLVPPLNRDKENESGLCAIVREGDFSLLCTGDAGTVTEVRLMERMNLENLTLLIAGHHGSAGSVSAELLERISPKAVVISVGRNSYGLPSDKTLARIRASGAVICRTDEQGSVVFRYRSGGRLWAN